MSLPYPETREDKYLAYLSGDTSIELPEPVTRMDAYLYYLCKSGVGGTLTDDQIKEALNAFLKENPDIIGIDETLSIGGKAADAKVTGDKIAASNLSITELMEYIGYPVRESVGYVGLQVDYENKTFMRLADAALYGKTAGSDFDEYNMFGGRKRCTVADDGTITSWYGDDNYAEDGSMGQVMVYQPAFYYKVVPLKLEEQTDGIGYHLRKANYYVSDTAKPGFKRHPLFFDKNGDEVDFALFSAFEGSLYDTSAEAYLAKDEQVMDTANDKFCSIANVKPASGLTQDLTRPNIELFAQNRGGDWHGDLIKSVSANQMLMIIELGMMDTQTGIENGVVSISDNSTYNCSSYTGSTIGNETGHAESTTNEINGTETNYSVNGKRSVTYRGVENPWGNIWKFVYGINIYGNGSQKGGIPYIASDFNFAESKNSGNYESVGFTITNKEGYISAMGYGDEDYDWIFVASECLGNSSLPVGDYTWITTDLNGYRIAQLGGYWNHSSHAGGFSWYLHHGVGSRYRIIGGRLVYIPTKQTSGSYAANIASWKQLMSV